MADKQVEDHNAFNRWDSVGASFMMALFPAFISIVFHDHDIKGAFVWGVIATAVAGGVFLLSLIISERFLGKIVNLAGWGLTIFYGIISVMMLIEAVEQKATQPIIELETEK